MLSDVVDVNTTAGGQEPSLPAKLDVRPDDHGVAFLTVGGTRPAGSANARNLQRARYCLNTESRILWFQTQTWTSAASATGPVKCGVRPT